MPNKNEPIYKVQNKYKKHGRWQTFYITKKFKTAERKKAATEKLRAKNKRAAGLDSKPDAYPNAKTRIIQEQGDKDGNPNY